MSVEPPKPLAVEQTRLSNGCTVVTVALDHLARAHVGVTLRGGPVHEDDRSWGLSHFLEHMVFRGTKTHDDARAVSEAADAFGGELDGSTFRDRVQYDTRVDPDDVGVALELLAEMMSAPRFEGIEVEKEILKEELLEAIDDEGQEIDADNLAFRDLFAGQPLARSIDGTPATLESFDKSMLQQFFSRGYGAGHMVLVAAGPLVHRALVEKAQATFGQLPTGPEPPVGGPHGADRARGRSRVVRTEDSQTSLRLVYETAGLKSPDRWALAVLARILDDGPSARIPARLIDEEGLAYDLWAGLSLHEGVGALELGGSVQHDRVGSVVRGLVRELDRLIREPVGDAELLRVQDRVRRDLRDLRDSPEDVVESLSRAALFGIPFDVEEADRAVRAVKPLHVRELAQSIIKADRARLVMVGLPTKKQVRVAEDAVAGLGT